MLDENDKKNVLQLSENKRKKSGKTSSGQNFEDYTPWGKQDFITRWLNGTALHEKIEIKKPDKKFVLLASVDGSRQIYEITRDNELKTANFEAVENTVARAMSLFFRDQLGMTDKQIDGAVRYWSKASDTVEAPQVFGWQDSTDLVMRRLPFPYQVGATPLFDEMMSRFTNSDALMAFIGSLFFPDSNMQQYVWMYGQGNDGKGTLSRFLARALGHLYSSQQTPAVTDRFWTYGIKDARLVVFPDTNNISFVTSGLFKALTGGDWIRVEIKGGKVFHIQPMAKFMFLSNEQPDLSSEKADQRRIIYCHCQSFEAEHDSTYEARLWLEGGYFLSKCVEAYKATCPNHEQIPTAKELIEAITETNEEPFSAFLENEFLFSRSFKCRASIFQQMLEKQFKTRKEQKECRNYMERRGFLRKGIKNPETQLVEYFYMHLKPRHLML